MKRLYGTGVAIVAALAVAAMAVPAAAADELHREIILAHSGGVSPKDDCHRDRKGVQGPAGERHWHKEGTRDRAGPCVKVDGKTWRFTGNALCARERVDLINDRDRWSPDWKRHVNALLTCVQRMPVRIGSRPPARK